MLGVKSLLLDEAFSVYAARLPWPGFLRTMWWGEANMALYYFLLRGWIHLGDSEFWLRCLSALFGVAAIPAVYVFGNRFLCRKAGLAAAALLAVHSFHIQYSQELRSYSLLTFLLIVSSYLFLKVLDTPGRKSLWLVYVVCSALSIYAHVFAVFVLASQWLVLTPDRIKRSGAVRLLVAGAVMGILTAPIAAVVLLEHKEQLNWAPPLSPASVWEIFQDLVGAGAAASQSLTLSIVLLSLYVATWVLAVVFFLRARQSRIAGSMTSVTLSLLASWLAFPIAAMMGISALKPILAPRYLLMCVPAAVLLAGWGLVALEERVPRGRLVSSAAVLMMFVLAFSGTRDYYASFETHGHKWREVTKYVLLHQEPDDTVIFYTFSGHYVFDYYAAHEKVAGAALTAPVVLFPLALERASIEKHTQPYRRVWLVLHQTRRSPVTDVQTELIRTALEAHFHLAGERKFPGHGIDHGESGEILVALFVAATAGQNGTR